MKKLSGIIIIAILLLYLLFVFFSMDQPFKGDEAQLPECARSILNKGNLLINIGYNNPNFPCSWHIPLFINVISIFIFLFGDNIYAIRSSTLIFSFLTIILVYLITKEILKKDKNAENWALLAAFFYAFNPLVIQNSIFVDIDGGLLNFSIYLFLYLFIKQKKYYFLIPSLILVFLSKEVGPIILFASLFLFYIFTNRIKKTPYIFGIFLISGIVSWILWYFYSLWIGLNFIDPLYVNFRFASTNLTILSVLVRIWEFKNFAYFMTPFFITLFILFSFAFYYKIIKKGFLNEEAKNTLLFNIVALVVMGACFYTGQSAYGFPKYQITSLPSISIFIIIILSKCRLFEYFKKNNKKIFVWILLALILCGYFLVFVKNPLMPKFDLRASDTGINYVLRIAVTEFAFYFLIPLVFSMFFLFLFKINNLKFNLVLSLLFLTIFCYIYLNSLHVIADYSTYAKYGDKNQLEVVEYFKNKGIPSNKIATNVNLGYYLGISNYFEIVLIYDNPYLFKTKVVDNKNVDYLAIWERDIGRIGKNIDYFELDKKVGSYYIFKKR